MATVNYITPITDRTREDVEYARLHQNDLKNKNKGTWNYTDLNRICNNLKYAAEYMYEQGFLTQPYSMQIKTDWKETDIITYEKLNAMIVNNMNNLKTYSRSDLEWYYIPSLANIDYTTANWIERNINALATQTPLEPDVFKLTVENGYGSGEYEANVIVHIQANPPDEGTVFDHWSGDHLENIDNPSTSYTTYKMPYQDVTLKANYVGIVNHVLKVKTYTKTETFDLVMGTNKKIEADPAPQGKVFHHWEVEPESYEGNLYEPAATTTFTMPNEDVTLTAVYITKGQKYLEVENGTGSGWYEYGSYVAVGPNLPENGTFTSWTGNIQYLTKDASSQYNSVRIPDVSRIKIKANWTTPPGPPYVPAKNVLLTVVNGTIDSTGETEGRFTEGDKVNITANPVPDGQVFTGWSYTGSKYNIVGTGGLSATITISRDDTTATAGYRVLNYHTLTVTTNSGTTTSTKEEMDRFSVNANPPPENYTFDVWSGDTYLYNNVRFEPTQASTGTYMGKSDRTLEAKYRPILTHTLTVKQLSGDTTYEQDEFTTINLEAEPAPEGKRFVRWNKSGPGKLSSQTASSIMFTFGNGDTTLTATYVNIWDITVVNGKIDRVGSSGTLDENSTYDLLCRDLAVYEHFDGWTIDGPGNIGNLASTKTSFTVGAGNATITANISQYPNKTLTIYMRDPDTNEDTLISSKEYTYGTHVEVIAPIAPNKSTFLTWLGDVDVISPSALASSIQILGLTKDTTIVATYYYPESPEYYTLTVYDGYPEEGSYAAGSQVGIRAKNPSQDWEFYKWYGDTQFLVDPDVTLSENSVIMPLKSISLYAKFKVIGETPLYRISVINGTAKGIYTDDDGLEHKEEGVYIDVPSGTSVTLTAEPDTVGYVFDYWSGNFTEAGITDIIVSENPATFTSTESDLNIMMVRRELNKYTVYTTNATGPGTAYGEGKTYSIAGNLQDTDDYHYIFNNWTCVDVDGNDCIEAIADPTSVSTSITLTDKDLWIEAVYTTYYKLTVIEGQDEGSGYYYEGEEIKTVYANTPSSESKLIFDHWNDPMGIVENIYDPTPKLVMKNSVATITAVFVSLDSRGNSVVITGNDLHTGVIRRSRTTLINGIYAVGTLVFDKDGCIGIITEVDPDQNDDTDDYKVEKLYYGGNL